MRAYCGSRRGNRAVVGLLVAAFAALVLIENGIWVRPGVQVVMRMARNPFINTIPELPYKHYLYTSYLGLVLGFICRAFRHVWTFAALHLGELIVGSIGCYTVVSRRFGADCARVLAGLFACVPLSAVLLMWLGLGDNLVFIFSTLVVAVTDPLWVMVAAYLLGLAHLEQGIFISILLIIGAISGIGTFGFDRRERQKKGLAIACGSALAYLTLHGIFILRSFHLMGSRVTYFTDRPLQEFLGKFFRHPVVTFYSLCLGGWIPLVICLRRLRKKPAALNWALASLGACAVLSMLVFDVTRVFSLVSWPVLLTVAIEADLRSVRLPWQSLRLTTFLLILSVLSPRLIVWDGRVHWSVRVLRYDWLVLRHQVDFRKLDWPYRPFS